MKKLISFAFLALSLSAFAEPVEPERAVSLLEAIDQSLEQQDLTCTQQGVRVPVTFKASTQSFADSYEGSSVELIEGERVIIRISDKADPHSVTLIEALLNQNGDLIERIVMEKTTKRTVRVNRGTSRRPRWVYEDVTETQKFDCR